MTSADMEKALELSRAYLAAPSPLGGEGLYADMARALLAAHAEGERLREALDSIKWKYVNETQVNPEDNYAKGRLSGLAVGADIACEALATKGE